MPKGKKIYPYVMDFIDDRATYKAVMFAANMLRNGETFNKAVAVASRYYDVNPLDIRHFLSQRSGRSQANKKSRRY